MIDQLRALIERASLRGYVRALKKDRALLAWVLEQTSSLPPDTELSERVYCCLHGNDRAICSYGQHKIFNTLEKGFRFCAPDCRCRREEQARKIKAKHAQISPEERQRRLDKQRETFLEKYGVDNPMKAPDVRTKIEATNIERYGVAVAAGSAVVREKIKETNRARRGVDMPLQSKTVRGKAQQTNLQRYGKTHTMDGARASFLAQNDGRNPFQVPAIVEKAKETMLERFGVERALSNETVLTAMQDRLEAEHGVRNVMHVDAVLERVIETNRERYGRLSPNQAHFSDESFETLIDPVKFREMFNGRSLREVSVELGVAYDTARKWCVRWGVELSRSTYEDAIADFLRNQGLTVRRSDRMLIKPFELDLVIEDHKLAIEFCGLYWHSEAHKDERTYHLRKLLMAKEQGWKLITIFEDEWINRRSVVEDRLLNAVGLSPRGVPARKVTVQPISSEMAREFLDARHLQGGSANGSIRYGAFEGETLIGVMTFGKPRVALGRRGGGLELLRFATDGRNHPGLASKLFAAFLRDHNPDEVVSYADRRWSEGGMYEALGFRHVDDGRPNYWYFHPSRIERKHRFGFRKDRIMGLVEGGAAMSERQIMNQLGYHRVWDCGHRKFVWTKP